MNDLWRATLNPHSPRYQEWRGILGDEKVPLVTPMAITAVLGQEKDEVYLLDWQNLDCEASERLLDFVCKRFGANPEEVALQLDKDGHFPIRTSDVIISFSESAFI
jgi:hypothetical protein